MQSMYKNRLMDQLSLLKAMYEMPVLIIEHDESSVSIAPDSTRQYEQY